jgi:Bacterial extracellular solute-binding protein
MRRLLAVAAAVAMVVISLVVRDRIDDGGGDGGDGEPAHLLCASELEPVCRTLADEVGDLEVTFEPAALTAAALTALPDVRRADLDFDGWLAPEPLVALVREDRARRGFAAVLEEPTDRLARSPLVLAVDEEREAVLEDACGGTIGWRCLGDVAGTSWRSLGGDPAWGAVRAGHADPTVSATGLLVLGQATTAYFDRADLATIDLDTDDGFAGWLARLEQFGSAPPFEELLAAGFVGFDAVGTTEAAAGPVLAEASPDRRAGVDLLYLDPVVTADLVLAPVTSAHAGDRVVDIVTGGDAAAALAAAGWRVDGEASAPGVRSRVALRRTSGLPSAGLLQALQQRWREATG